MIPFVMRAFSGLLTTKLSCRTRSRNCSASWAGEGEQIKGFFKEEQRSNKKMPVSRLLLKGDGLYEEQEREWQLNLVQEMNRKIESGDAEEGCPSRLMLGNLLFWGTIKQDLSPARWGPHGPTRGFRQLVQAQSNGS